MARRRSRKSRRRSKRSSGGGGINMNIPLMLLAGAVAYFLFIKNKPAAIPVAAAPSGSGVPGLIASLVPTVTQAFQPGQIVTTLPS